MPMWMPMCGDRWPGAALSFIGMWVPMMLAMMLPAIAPALWRWRAVAGTAGELRGTALTALVAAGYFAVWTALGVAVFPLGAVLSTIEMRQPMLAHAAPLAIGAVLLVAGLLQFTAWKARRLACCRALPPRSVAWRAGTAWRHGLRLGLHCVHCCAGLTAVLLVIGVMELRAMAAVTAAITVERFAGPSAARAIGAVLIAAGAFVIGRAALG
jgi:predicted metal-binding membrane protein